MMKRIQKTLIWLLPALTLLSGCAKQLQSTEEENKVNGYHQITQEEALLMMGRDDGHVIVDVRRQDEYDSGHIPEAILIPNESIGTELPEMLPDKEQIILIYCRSGRRSKEAAEKLAKMGYTNVYEFGGIMTWTGETVSEEAAVSSASEAEPRTSLEEKFPEYFGLDTFKGLEVYVWQMAKDSYSFGLMTGTNRVKTFEELMHLKGTTAAEMRAILSTYDIPMENVIVIPWQNPISSYIGEYWIREKDEDPAAVEKRREEYVEMLRKMLFDGQEAEKELQLWIGETSVPVTWEENASVQALRELLPLTVKMSKYGGFEQVGAIGHSIARDDSRITTVPGDIVLYSGDQLVLFYGSNTWSYTRLGHVELTESEMRDLLSEGDVTVIMKWSDGES